MGCHGSVPGPGAPPGMHQQLLHGHGEAFGAQDLGFQQMLLQACAVDQAAHGHGGLYAVLHLHVNHPHGPARVRVFEPEHQVHPAYIGSPDTLQLLPQHRLHVVRQIRAPQTQRGGRPGCQGMEEVRRGQRMGKEVLADVILRQGNVSAHRQRAGHVGDRGAIDRLCRLGKGETVAIRALQVRVAT